jgi:uncharacterized protein
MDSTPLPDRSNHPGAFWKTKTLIEMTNDEWEALCDGCARCCLEKIVRPDTGAITYTAVACRHLKIDECRCAIYDAPLQRAAVCIQLHPKIVSELHWLPATCAYRLIAEGKDLPTWHPLVSGDPQRVHQAGISVRDWAIPGRFVSDNVLEAYTLQIEW